MQTDSLYRLSIKCLIMIDDHKVLVVKERGRTVWDLPGGGVDRGETIREAVTRELYEEVGYTSGFDYKVIALEDPAKLANRDVWQVRVIVQVFPESLRFTTGAEADEIAFKARDDFKDSDIRNEQRIYKYVGLAQ